MVEIEGSVLAHSKGAHEEKVFRGGSNLKILLLLPAFFTLAESAPFLSDPLFYSNQGCPSSTDFLPNGTGLGSIYLFSPQVTPKWAVCCPGSGYVSEIELYGADIDTLPDQVGIAIPHVMQDVAILCSNGIRYTIPRPEGVFEECHNYTLLQSYNKTVQVSYPGFTSITTRVSNPYRVLDNIFRFPSTDAIESYTGCPTGKVIVGFSAMITCGGLNLFQIVCDTIGAIRPSIQPSQIPVNTSTSYINVNRALDDTPSPSFKGCSTSLITGSLNAGIDIGTVSNACG